jgi:hypothetical protein
VAVQNFLASAVHFRMPKKSVFRQPGAQHFQLVHRSQRDPLIHDPDASQHVLKPVERPNAKKVCCNFYEHNTIDDIYILRESLEQT